LTLHIFKEQKNQGNQLLSHLVTAAFRLHGTYWSSLLNRERPGTLPRGGHLCKTQGAKGLEKGRIVSNIKDSIHLLQAPDTCRRQTGQKSLVMTKSRKEI